MTEAPEEAAVLAENAGQVPLEETVTEVLAPDPNGPRVTLQPYQHWAARTLPDPRQLDSLDPVAQALCEIIGAEGPMTCKQAYRLYAKAAGIHYGKVVQSAFNKAVTRALRAGTLTQTDEWRTPGQVDKVVRLDGHARSLPA